MNAKKQPASTKPTLTRESAKKALAPMYKESIFASYQRMLEAK